MFVLCQENDLEDDMPIECDGPDGALIVVVRHAGQYYAVQGLCPHQEAPLADGEVENGCITCCLHYWSWQLADGTPVEEAESPLTTYPVKAVDGAVCLVEAS